MNSIKKIYFTSLLAIVISNATAQKSTFSHTTGPAGFPVKKAPISDNELQRWSHLDLTADTIPGMSVDKAYREFLKDKKSTDIIVAVIDSGFDIEHEDLKPVIWTNPKEIAGNGIDDDKNGYTDDVHGWNFLGDIVYENLEMTRIVKKGDDGSQMYKDAKAQYDTQFAEESGSKQQVDLIMAAHKAVSGYLKKNDYTLEEVRNIVPNATVSSQEIKIVVNVIRQKGPGFYNGLKEYADHTYDMLNYDLNLQFDARKTLGDDPDDLTKTIYGNNNVHGPADAEAIHGTHVAGIIAQIRNNAKGGDGVADHVSIMAIRAVPDGDEYDKDIALAIRYAVDNGAKVINGSFGKSYSPHKQWVFDAIKYAASKDVLIVHAAGNDGHDIDLPEFKNYPSDSDDLKQELADNVLTIGALNTYPDSRLVARFSNYGTLNVDIFAPGMQIYATVPNNSYKFLQGTSMASPNAAGVAALIRSRYPNLKAGQVKQIIMDSGTPVMAEVDLGESAEKRPFAKASKSGRIVNAYNALVMAKKIAKK